MRAGGNPERARFDADPIADGYPRRRRPRQAGVAPQGEDDPATGSPAPIGPSMVIGPSVGMGIDCGAG